MVRPAVQPPAQAAPAARTRQHGQQAEGDCKVAQQVELAPQLLLVAQLAQARLVVGMRVLVLILEHLGRLAADRGARHGGCSRRLERLRLVGGAAAGSLHVGRRSGKGFES